MSIAEWIRRCARWRPQHTAYIDGERRFTFAEFNARVNRQVAGLHALGVVRGDRVAVLLNNNVEAIEAVAAAAKGGFVHVPVNFRLNAREAGDQLRHCGAKVVFVDAEYLARLDGAGLCPELKRVIVVQPGIAGSEFERWLAAQPDAEPTTDVTGEDNFFICYTSGATGTPKGVLHQQRQSIAHAPVIPMYYEIDADSKLLLVYPHNSIAAINMFYIPAWLMGATLVLTDQRHFDAERWLSLVQREKVTHCHMVPTMLFRVLESAKLASTDVSSLRTIGYGSAPMPTERIERLMQTFGNIFIHGYGMTEISSIATVLGKREHREAMAGDRKLLSSCGRPAFGCELRVVDDDDQPVLPGQPGEIIMRGPQMMSGYWNEPEKTAETLRGGWLRSGDIATVDAQGYLSIVDRKKDLIISGGANISSREVEEVLYWHPAVREAAVIGRPNDEWGELPHAIVSLNEGAVVTGAEIVVFCRERLAHFKCPATVDIVPELPKNALGKILKTELRQRFWADRQRMVN